MTRSAWPAISFGFVVALIGAVLTIGGAWLAALSGSLYYLLTGLTMIVSGALLARARPAGGWLYVAIVALTNAWAF